MVCVARANGKEPYDLHELAYVARANGKEPYDLHDLAMFPRLTIYFVKGSFCTTSHNGRYWDLL